MDTEFSPNTNLILSPTLFNLAPGNAISISRVCLILNL